MEINTKQNTRWFSWSLIGMAEHGTALAPLKYEPDEIENE
jgi:hypothetical protein